MNSIERKETAAELATKLEAWSREEAPGDGMLLRSAAECLRKYWRLENDYMKLILSVETLYPDESRYETALRYIREAEQRDSDDQGYQEKY